MVWRARASDGAPVALKVMTTVSQADAAAFLREQKMQARLGAEAGFVPLLDAGLEAGRAWLAMPLLEGGSLRDRLRRGPLPRPEALELLGQLARALGQAHAQGIVHRDLKPENVLFDAQGRPLVADLGLAKHFLPAGPGATGVASLTASGMFVGTPGYMAPEQAVDGRRAGPAADVFALGVLLFECLSGEPPFSTHPLRGFLEAGQGATPTLASRGVSAPAWLETLVRRCLASDPAARFPHAGALADALAAGDSAAPGTRSRGPLIAAALVLLGGAGAAGVLLVRGGRAPTASAPPRPAQVVPPPAPVPEPPQPPRTDQAREVAAWTAPAGHGEPVNFAVLRADGQMAITTGEDARVLVWDLSGGAARARALDFPRARDEGTQTAGAAWDPRLPTRVWVATSNEAGIMALDAARPAWTGRSLSVPPRGAGSPPAHAFALLWWGERLLASTSDGRVLAWRRGPDGELDDGPEVVADAGVEGSYIYDLKADPTGRLIGACHAGGARVWEEGRELARLAFPEGGITTSALLVGPDRALVASPHGLAVFDLQGRLLERLVRGSRVNSLARTADLDLLVSVEWEGALRQWRREASGRFVEVPGPTVPPPPPRLLNAVDCTPDGRRLIVGDRTGGVLVLEEPGGVVRRLPPATAHAGAVVELVPSLTGGVISAGEDGALRRWSDDGARVDTIPGTGPWGPRCVGPLAGGRLAVRSLDGQVLVVDPSASKARPAAVGRASQLTCDGTGRLLAALGSEGQVWVGSPPSPDELTPAPDRWSTLAWAGEGQLLLGTAGGRLVRLSLKEGQPSRQEQLLPTPQLGLGLGAISHVVPIAPRGVAVATEARQLLCIPDLDQPLSLATRPLHGPITGLAASPLLVAAIVEGRVVLLRRTPGGTPLSEGPSLELPPGDAASALLFLPGGDLLVGTRQGRLLRYASLPSAGE